MTDMVSKLYPQLGDYYKKWIHGAELVAILPVKENSSHKYYASGNVSAVFMYKNPQILTVAQFFSGGEGRAFLFDSEFDRLWCWDKTLRHIARNDFDKHRKHIEDNPIVIFFKGCDDGHVGKRFPTKQAAFEFLSLLDTFDDVFEFDLEYHN